MEDRRNAVFVVELVIKPNALRRAHMPCYHWFPLPVSCFLDHRPQHGSNLVVMKHKVDIPRSLCIVSDKVIIPLWTLLLGIARKHTLQADAYALDVVYRRPALSVK